MFYSIFIHTSYCRKNSIFIFISWLDNRTSILSLWLIIKLRLIPSFLFLIFISCLRIFINIFTMLTIIIFRFKLTLSEYFIIRFIYIFNHWLSIFIFRIYLMIWINIILSLLFYIRMRWNNLCFILIIHIYLRTWIKIQLKYQIFGKFIFIILSLH